MDTIALIILQLITILSYVDAKIVSDFAIVAC